MGLGSGDLLKEFDTLLSKMLIYYMLSSYGLNLLMFTFFALDSILGMSLLNLPGLKVMSLLELLVTVLPLLSLVKVLIKPLRRLVLSYWLLKSKLC